MGSIAGFVAFDSRDPHGVAAFWAEVLGYRLDSESEDHTTIVDPAGARIGLYFQKVPEPKVLKNRVHLDLIADGPLVDEVERVVRLGASVYRPFDGWIVLQDPEGNEFCIAQGVPGAEDEGA